MPDSNSSREDQSKIYAGVVENVSKQTLMTWMPSPNLFALKGDILEVYSPLEFNSDWLSQNYGNLILKTAKEVLGRNIRVNFITDETRYNELYRPFEEPEPISTETGEKKASMRTVEKKIPYILQGSDWIQHPGNAMGFARAHEVINSAIDREQIVYPLCFIGKNGVGKTALLSYIAKEVIKQGKYAGYLDIDDLSNYLRETNGEEGSGIEHMRRSHVLLIDSLERLINNGTHREGCQKRITEVMDLAHSNKVPLVCSFVGNYEGFREFAEKVYEKNTTLSSRLSGLEKIAVSAPVHEGRQEFILSLLKVNDGVSKTLNLPLVAKHMNKIFPRESSIREMQGEIRIIMARAEEGGLTLSQLYEILGYKGYEEGEQISLIRRTNPALVIDSLLGFFQSEFPNISISISDIQGKSDNEAIRNVREFTAYALKEISELSPKEIGVQLNRNEITVKAYIKRVSENHPENLGNMLDHLREVLESNINQ